MRRYFVPLSVCLAVVVLAVALRAGPLDPPAGPVASTYKTLTEVEPRTAINAANTPGDNDSLFKITQPGSYYLTGNITGVFGMHGIEIAASGVTLDLMGFDLAGVPPMGLVAGVIATGGGLTNIAVVNGSLRDWGSDGIDLGNSGATGCRVEGVRASGNLRYGILTGNNAQVSGCSATGGQIGIRTGSGATLSNCSASGASIYGINTEFGCTLSNCSAYENTGTGIFANSGSTVEGCTAGANTLDGIFCTSGCTIRGNTCSANGSGAGDGAGIHAFGGDNRIESNNCTLADRGIDVDAAGNIIIRNTCAGNTTDWVIVANNVVGPILDRRAPASAAINGFSAPDSTGSTHPNANFSY